VIGDAIAPNDITKFPNIERLVTFPGSSGIVITKPTVKRPSMGVKARVAGLPRVGAEGAGGAGASWFSFITLQLSFIAVRSLYNLFLYSKLNKNYEGNSHDNYQF